MESIPDVPVMVAPQWVSTAVNGPCFTGWSLQVLLCGIATDRAIQLLRSGKGLYSRSAVAKALFVAAIISNIVAAAACLWSIVAWGVDQNRSIERLTRYKVPDAISTGAVGLTAGLSQSFMAIRCWKVLRRSRLFAAFIATAISTALGATVWMTVSSVDFMSGKGQQHIFTSTQIWVWCSVLIDLTITTCLAVHLHTLKQGFNPKTDSVLRDLIRISIETCAMPLLFASTGAIFFISTTKSATLWNLCVLTLAPSSSAYVLSLVHCQTATANKRDQLGGLSVDALCVPTLPSAVGQHHGLSDNEDAKSEGTGAPSRNSYDPRSWEPPLEWKSVAIPLEEEPIYRPAFRRYPSSPFKVNHSLPSLPASVTQAQPVRPSSLDIPYLREQED